MQNRIFVTGAAGFLGSHCVIQLLKQGWYVTAAIRSVEQDEFLTDLEKKHAITTDQLHLQNISLEDDKEKWCTALSSHTHLLHLAAPVPAGEPKNRDLLIKTITKGSETVLKAAINENIQQVVLSSSITSIYHGNSANGNLLDETLWTDLSLKKLPAYSLAKTIAEQKAWQLSSQSEIKLTTILPGLILGPTLSSRHSGSLELIIKLMNGAYPGIPKLGWPIVDVRDVASLIVLCLDNPKAYNERFICTNKFAWLSEVAKILSDKYPAYKSRIPQRKIPDFVVRIWALFDPVSRFIVSDLGNKIDFTNAKAKETLNWQPAYWDRCFTDTVQQLFKLNKIKPIRK